MTRRKPRPHALPELEEPEVDGLYVPLIRSWSERKLRICWYYDEIFATGMKNSPNGISYIDLFAGAGFGRIQGTTRVVPTSGILCHRIPNRFSKYILCEKAPRKLNALVARVNRLFPDSNVSFVQGDCNEKAEEIAQLIPKGPLGRMPLAFCFVDPNSLGIHFSTISTIVRCCPRVDFLVLLALGMDALRNKSRYVDGTLRHVDTFLGDSRWRYEWKEKEVEGVDFRKFLVDSFVRQMSTLGYLDPPVKRLVEFRTEDQRLPLYHLAFFSKHARGYEFWEKILPYADPQGELAFDF